MNSHAEKLLEKIDNRSALVGIIGLGYVGLPLALAFTEKGFNVLGFDVDPEKVDKINRGESYIKHLNPTRLARATGLADSDAYSEGRASGKSEIRNPKSEISKGDDLGNSQLSTLNSKLLSATTDFSRLSEADAILICVPTPLGPHKEPDLQYVESSARAIRTTLRPGQLVILESTTYPGTTDELLRSILEKPSGEGPCDEKSEIRNPKSEISDAMGDGKSEIRNPKPKISVGEGGRELSTLNSQLSTLSCGDHFFLAFSPEREDPGNPKFGTTNVPKVVGGVDPVSGDLAQALYDQIIDSTVRVASARIAEASKLTENIFRSVNIALVNELKIIYDRLGIDVWEVLDAAATKPFGFMRFNPGPGLGGHCIIGSEWLRIRGCGLAGVYRAADLFGVIARRFPAAVTRNGIFVEPEGLEALALDAESGDVTWFPVTTLYRGRYEGSGRQITTNDDRRLIVTSEHPMLVVNTDGVDTIPARELRPGDVLPLVSDFGDPCDNPVIDLLDIVPDAERDRVWVRMKGRAWSEHESVLKSHFGWTIRDSIRNNSLRLDRFLVVESEVGVDREDLVLMTGRGTARRDWPTALEVTPEFARFIGYYLAEGCVTVERNAARVRLTFNRDERAYIEDAIAILGRHGFATSTYNDATWHSTTIKASSLLLVWLLDKEWWCGRRSEEMRIPDLFFRLSPEHKWQLLSGLLRGDGDVWTRTGKATYKKNGKEYTHHNATAVVGYFSSSQVLLEQVVHLLQDLGFQPAYKKWKHHIRLAGHQTVENLIPFLAGAKRERLKEVQRNRRRRVTSRSDEPPLAPGLRSTVVEAVDNALIDGWVYSMEVEGAATFTTSSGIAVHNCIPLDPFYLAWSAREAGVPTKFIELAGEINTAMPGYVIDKLQTALNEHGKAMKGAKVLVLGLAYKPDIDDPRESPAFEIIDRLLELGAEVSYHDPHIPMAPSMRSWPDLPAMNSVDLNPETLAAIDAAVLITDHKNVDYNLVLDHALLIIDTRGVYRDYNGKVHPA